MFQIQKKRNEKRERKITLLSLNRFRNLKKRLKITSDFILTLPSCFSRENKRERKMIIMYLKLVSKNNSNVGVENTVGSSAGSHVPGVSSSSDLPSGKNAQDRGGEVDSASEGRREYCQCAQVVLERVSACRVPGALEPGVLGRGYGGS